jgi:hypothetical protein
MLAWPAFAQVDSSGTSDVFPDSEHRLEDEQTETTHTLVKPLDMESTRLYQGEKVSSRHFDERQWRKIVGDVDFAEVERPEKKKESESKGISMPWSGPLLQMMSYVFVIAIALLLVWFIVRNVSFDMRIKRSKIEDDPEKPVENIEDLDIQSMLDQAAREGNYKLAVRLHYLRLLKKLNELGMIAWKKDKTNRDYLAELFSRDFHFADIRRLTVFYESVWYGDHMLQTDTFQILQNQFEMVHQRITKEAVS